ncbi:Alpha/Beta hydrolase protein [Papiliotrema laurentii]|uniref:Alpha/Beta hydrolase protein n=1 Tax=Papiliotrema laurentii TaxID=5418 RepID=A0AAD9FMK4_PAPLA|nr:Alpha/Beta hydrolase protein [Papiliotrema laurentii]
MLRQLASLGFGLHHRADPPAPRPSRSRRIESTLSNQPGKDKIQLDIWQPPSATRNAKARPCVIVFHGGGFVLGSGTDDARWAAVLMDQLDAIVIAVNYRVAPGYPFPTPVEDCADGILHVIKNAKTYGVDPDKIVVSGFSAASPGNWDYPDFDTTPYRIRGIVLFYPLLDFTITRKDKKESSSRPDFCLPDSMTSLFDQSYLHPASDRSDPRISPGLAPDDMLSKLPPLHLCCCEWDMLYNEAAVFKDRLVALGKEVVWREVKEEKHAWDKPPPLAPKKSVVEEYVEAVQSVKRLDFTG